MDWTALGLLAIVLALIAIAPRQRLIRDGPTLRFPISFRACWADTVPLGLGLVLGAAFLAMHLLLDFNPTTEWLSAVVRWLLVLWIVLRAVDLVFGGPVRRRLRRGLPS
jgi:hypothetical protein